jgi:hypothetical protein
VSPALPVGWSSSWTAGDGILTIEIAAIPAAGGLTVDRVRVGPVLLDLELRRLRSTLRIRLRHRQGPAATLCLRLPVPGPGLVEVDGVTLQGNPVRFMFSGEHEVVAYY